MGFTPICRFVAFLTAFSLMASVSATEIRLRPGTTVYGELDERVASKKKKFSNDQIIRAHIRSDVYVEGTVLIEAGTPLIVQIAKLKKRKIFGRSGVLELEAVTTTAIDGSLVLLDGGYDQSGKGRVGLAIAGFVFLAWPLMFVRGNHAVLERGAIFDATVEAPYDIVVASNSSRPIKLNRGARVSVVVLYDEVDEGGKDDNLPLQLKACGTSIGQPTISSVNGDPIEPIEVTVVSIEQVDGCEVVNAIVSLKTLGQHFRSGMNYFAVDFAGESMEVLLEIEL